MKAASGLNLRPGHFVPSAQLCEGDAEAVGYGDQGISLARGIEQRPHGSRRDGSGGHDKGFEALDAVRRAKLIDAGKLGLGDVELARNRGQSVGCGDAMVAPGVAPGLRDERDALPEERGRAGREVEIEGFVRGSD